MTPLVSIKNSGLEKFHGRESRGFTSFSVFFLSLEILSTNMTELSGDMRLFMWGKHLKQYIVICVVYSSRTTENGFSQHEKSITSSWLC